MGGSGKNDGVSPSSFSRPRGNVTPRFFYHTFPLSMRVYLLAPGLFPAVTAAVTAYFIRNKSLIWQAIRFEVCNYAIECEIYARHGERVRYTDRVTNGQTASNSCSDRIKAQMGKSMLRLKLRPCTRNSEASDRNKGNLVLCHRRSGGRTPWQTSPKVIHRRKRTKKEYPRSAFSAESSIRPWKITALLHARAFRSAGVIKKYLEIFI